MSARAIGRGRGRGRGRPRAVPARRSVDEILAELSPGRVQELAARLRARGDGDEEEVSVGEVADALSEVVSEAGAGNSDRYADVEPAAGSGAVSDVAKVFSKLDEQAADKRVRVAKTALKAKLKDVVHAADIGPALGTNEFCLVVRAVAECVEDLSAGQRRAVVASLIDGTSRAAVAAAVQRMDEAVFGDKGERVSAGFARAFALALRVELDLAHVKCTSSVAVFFADLLLVADACSADADGRVSDVKKCLSRVLSLPAWLSGSLSGVRTRAQLEAWFDQNEANCRRGGGQAAERQPKKPKLDKAKKEQQSEGSGAQYVISAAGSDRALLVAARIRTKDGDAVGAPLDALLDTGAEATLVDAATARLHGLVVDSRSPPALSGLARNSSFRAIGRTSLTVHVGGFTASEAGVIVVEGMRYPLVLGSCALRRAKIVLDASSGEWLVKLPGCSVKAKRASAAHAVVGEESSICATAILLPGGATVSFVGDVLADPVAVGAVAPAAQGGYKFRTAVDEMCAAVDMAVAAAACNTTPVELERFLRHHLGRLDSAGLLRTKHAPGYDGPLPAIKGFKAHAALRPDADLSKVTAVTRFLGTKRAEQLQAKLDELERDGVIERLDRSTRSIALSPAFVLPKYDDTGKPTGKMRLVVDMRNLNAQCVGEQYPTPLIPNLLSQAANGVLRSKFDLADYFHQIDLDEASRQYFDVLGNGERYRYNRLSLGFVSAPAVAQRVVESIFGDLGAALYVDDICLSGGGQKALDDIVKFVDRCIEYRVTVNASKSRVLQPSLHLLGHTVGENSVAPLRERLDLLRSWPVPTTRRQLQRFLGVANYYRSFLPAFARVAAPLHAKQSPKVKFAWSDDDSRTFEAVKVLLLKHATKSTVNLDQPLILYTDASRAGTAFVFVQQQEGGEKIIEMGGYGLSKHEKNYAVHELELLALAHAVRACPDLVQRRLPTEWRSDNQTAVLALSSKMPLDKGSVAIANFVARVQGLNIVAKKIGSAENAVADAVSRVHAELEPRVVAVAVASDGEDDAGAGEDVEVSDGLATPALVQDTSRVASPRSERGSKAAMVVETGEAEESQAGSGVVASADASAKSEVTSSSAPAPVSSPLALWTFPLPLAGREQRPPLRDWAREQQADEALEPYFASATGQKVPFVVQQHRPCVDPASGLLYVRDRRDRTQTRLVAPKSRVRELLRLAHDSVDGAHAGARHTRFVLEQAVWWPGMSEEIARYTQSCLQCRSHKEPARDAELGELHPLARRFGDIHIDWVPMPESKSGLSGFYIVRDTATGWLQLYPFAGLSADNAKRALESWIADHDNPDSVNSDAGKEVTANALKEFASKEGFALRSSSVANQRSNAIVESVVKDVKKLVLIQCRARGGDVSQWPSVINAVKRGMNRRFSSSRGASPFQLVFGGLPHLSLLGEVPHSATSSAVETISDEPVPRDAKQFVQELGAKIVAGIRDANKQRHRRHVVNARYRRAVGKQHAISVGDYVNLANTSDSAPTYLQNKQRQWGPFKVIGINAKERRVRLQRCADNKVVGPFAMHRLIRLDAERVEEIVEADAARGIVGWQGAADPSLLLPAEQMAVKKSIAKVAKAGLPHAAQQRRERALAEAAERKAARQQICESRRELRVKPSAVPRAKLFTPAFGPIYRVGKEDIDGATDDSWVYPRHELYERLAGAHRARELAEFREVQASRRAFRARERSTRSVARSSGSR